MSLNSYRKRTISDVHHLSAIRTDVENYTDRYKDDGDLYNCLSYGSPAISKGVKFAQWLASEMKKDDKILCVGCGEGYEVVKHLKNGFDAYGTELHSINVPYLKDRTIQAQCPDLPFKDDTFDMLSCTEVLEHIEPSVTNSFLKECMRVAKRFYFSIATEKDGYNTHINLHGLSWWYDKFLELKFNIKNIQFKPMIDIVVAKGVMNRFSYTEGICVYASKDI